MTTTINASTTAGLVQTADTSGVLALQTAGTTAVTVDASQNVGIGTASPANKLHVFGTEVRVQQNASYYSLFDTAGTRYGYMQGGSGYLDIVSETGSANTIRFTANSSERARINTYGIGLGGAVPSSGTGITFPAAQSASSDANTLDDYEEGTFTPTMAPSSGSWTTSSKTGRYVKVGQTVTLFMSLTITTVGTGSGYVTISGMPFTAFNPSIGAGNRAGVGIAREDATSGVAYQVFIDGNTTQGNLQGLVTATTVTQGNGYVFQMSLQYITAT